jgi:SAM-dependent methyltransferase
MIAAMTFDQRRDCLVCDSPRTRFLFMSHGYQIVGCGDCGLQFQWPQPSDAVLESIYSADYALGERTAEGQRRVAEMKRATARMYLRQLLDRVPAPGTLLEIGSGSGDLLVEARAAGIDVSGVEVSPHATATANERLGQSAVVCGTLGQVTLPRADYDVCVLSDVVEHDRDPVEFLRQVHALLKPGGAVYLSTASTGHWTARALGRHWMEYKIEHLTYFGPKSMKRALGLAGFRDMELLPNVKSLTPEYVWLHFERFQVPLVSPAVGLAYKLLPPPVKHHQFNIVASGMAVLARA